MKLILTGTTGFIGHEVLQQALSHPLVSSIITLTRNALPAPFSSDPKIKSILVEDFSTYSPSVLEQLKGAEACVWCLGAKSPDPVIARKVSLGYTLTAVEAFSHLPEKPKKFRFIFTSGILAVRPGKTIYFPYAKEARRIGGELETSLLEFAEKNDGVEAFIMRPSGVTPKERGVLKSVVAELVPMIRVNELAAVMLDVAVSGAGKQTWENGDLVERGRKVLGSGDKK